MRHQILFLTLTLSPTFITSRLIPKDVRSSNLMQDDGKCVMSGVCGETHEEMGYAPCSISTDHHKFEDDDQHMIQVLRDECPELFSTNDPNEMPEVCCTAQELREIQQKMNFFQKYYGNCQSCLAHAKQVVCHLGCAPNQNKFLKVTESEAVADSGSHRVSDVVYYLSKTFFESTFETCRRVPRMIEELNKTTCAGNLEACTMDDFTGIIGMKNVNVLYQLNFVLSDDPVTDADGRTFIPAPLMIPDKCSEPDCDKGCR